MKDKIKGLLTRKKLFRFFKIAVIVVLTTIALLSLLGTVAHASGLVDDTVNADNLYSQYPLENYQLDFYVDNSWGWLPWNWLDGIGTVSYTHLLRSIIPSGIFIFRVSCCKYSSVRKLPFGNRLPLYYLCLLYTSRCV